MDVARNFFQSFLRSFKVFISPIIGSKNSQNLLSLHIQDLYVFFLFIIANNFLLNFLWIFTCKQIHKALTEQLRARRENQYQVVSELQLQEDRFILPKAKTLSKTLSQDTFAMPQDWLRARQHIPEPAWVMADTPSVSAWSSSYRQRPGLKDSL